MTLFFILVVTGSLSRRAFVSGAISAMCSALVCAVPVYAQAAPGNVRCVRRRLHEHDQAWRLMVRIRLPKQPDKPEVTLHFQLTQTVDFLAGEGDTPKQKRVAPPRVITIEQAVDLRDIRGQIGRSARAHLSLARDAGFRAGVWQLRVHSSDGPIGRDTELVLRGVNEPSAKPDAPADADAGLGSEGGS